MIFPSIAARVAAVMGKLITEAGSTVPTAAPEIGRSMAAVGTPIPTGGNPPLSAAGGFPSATDGGPCVAPIADAGLRIKLKYEAGPAVIATGSAAVAAAAAAAAAAATAAAATLSGEGSLS